MEHPRAIDRTRTSALPATTRPTRERKLKKRGGIALAHHWQPWRRPRAAVCAGARGARPPGRSPRRAPRRSAARGRGGGRGGGARRTRWGRRLPAGARTAPRRGLARAPRLPWRLPPVAFVRTSLPRALSPRLACLRREAVAGGRLRVLSARAAAAEGEDNVSRGCSKEDASPSHVLDWRLFFRLFDNNQHVFLFFLPV